MKRLELLPTPENLITTIQNNALERNVFIQNFICLLTSIEGNYSIALDGRWGSGKSFFVKQTEFVLRQLFDKNEEKVDIIHNIFKGLFINDSIMKHPMKTFYYDAWSHDNQQDALLSLLFELIKLNPLKNQRLQIRPSKLDITQSTIISIANSIVKKASGIDIKEISHDIQNNSINILSKLQEQEELDKLINKYLTSILPPKPTRLVIFIDELDRCRPDYTVQLLERIKHYMTLNRITFVFSLNYDQLQHTIKRYYGNDFEASMYLDKFFDLHISLPVPDLFRRRDYFIFGQKDSIFNEWCQKLVDEFKLELRELLHYRELIRQTIYTYDNYFEQFKSHEFDHNKVAGTLAFLNFYFAPLALILFIKDINLYYEFIDGKYEKCIEVIIKNIDSIGGEHLCKVLKVKYTPGVVTTLNEIYKPIQILYHCIFSKTYTYEKEFDTVGTLYVDGSIREIFINQISVLGRIKDYQSTDQD